jgi:FkbH-like protein
MQEANSILCIRSFEDVFSAGDLILKKRFLQLEAARLPECQTIRIAILKDSTTRELTEYLAVFLRFKGLRCAFWQGDFNRIYEDAIFRLEELRIFDPDVILIHETGRWIQMNDADASNHFFGRYRSIWDSLMLLGCPIVQTNLPLPVVRPCQNSECIKKDGNVRHIMLINRWIAEEAEKDDLLFVLDLNYISAAIGQTQWYDNRLWYLYGCAYSQNAVPRVAFSLGKALFSMFGFAHKLLVLDLDNTLWGGIWADDGSEGIALGGETPEGRAYQEFQQYILQLKKNGMILAACSKNNAEAVTECFNHPSSALKWQDFSAVRVNWDTKSNNIIDIARELNLCLDSTVFLDDSPFERMAVRNELPQVWVPELMGVENYLLRLEQGLIFEQWHSFTLEDRQRAQYYDDNQRRSEMRTKFASKEIYLRDLRMKLHIVPAAQNIGRIVQLINKVNQFQVTGKRSSEKAIETYIRNHLLFAVRLEDIFGDNGIVSVLGASIVQDVAVIDYWVMSCRVFQRGVEHALLSVLIERCAQISISRIQLVYVRTEKNAMLKETLLELGFVLACEIERGFLYEMETGADRRTKDDYIEVCYDEGNNS